MSEDQEVDEIRVAAEELSLVGKQVDVWSETEGEDEEVSSLDENHVVVDAVRDYVGKWYQITLTDTRIVKGKMMCTDKDANIVLGGAEERWPEEETSRYLSYVLITKPHITKMIRIPNPRNN